FLTQAEVEDIEQRRHVANTEVFVLYLGLDPIVAGLKNFNRSGPSSSAPETPWDPQYGMLSEVFPFWTASVAPIRIEVEQSTWVRDVLPGLGYKRGRLLEMVFPP